MSYFHTFRVCSPFFASDYARLAFYCHDDVLYPHDWARSQKRYMEIAGAVRRKLAVLLFFFLVSSVISRQSFSFFLLSSISISIFLCSAFTPVSCFSSRVSRAPFPRRRSLISDTFCPLRGS